MNTSKGGEHCENEYHKGNSKKFGRESRGNEQAESDSLNPGEGRLYPLLQYGTISLRSIRLLLAQRLQTGCADKRHGNLLDLRVS
jgi:hypothetical protein